MDKHPVKINPIKVLLAVQKLSRSGVVEVSSTDVINATGGSSATVRRHLEALCLEGLLTRHGKARATRYRLAGSAEISNNSDINFLESPAAPYGPVQQGEQPAWSAQSQALVRKLNKPLAARNPVTYQRDFVDRYVPNQSSFLPVHVADRLYQAGRLREQQPAGTYARKVLEQLLIDLSWSSSRLEGNRYSLLATEELFKRGMVTGDMDTVMLMNHKTAIEFLVDTVPLQGLTSALLKSLHTALMQDLLEDMNALGAIRQKVVNISDTVYVPTQVPALLNEMLNLILEKARLIKNPWNVRFFCG